MAETAIPPRLRASALACYIEIARFIGVDPFLVLREAHVSPKLIPAPEAWLPSSAVAHVLERTAELSGRDDLGILLAECQTLATMGPVALLVEHERSVRGIVEAAIEFRPLVGDAITMRIEEGGDTAIVAFEVDPISPQLTALVAGAAQNILSDAVEGTWKPKSVHFRRSTPSHALSFKQFFRCDVEFDAAFNGFSTSIAELERLSPLRGTVACQLCSKPSVLAAGNGCCSIGCSERQ